MVLSLLRPLALSPLLALGLAAFAPVGLAQNEKIAFEVTFEALGLAEDAKPSEARMTVDGVTLTVSAGNHQLNNASKAKAVGIVGNRTGQINGDERLTLTFDQPVLLRRMDLNGLKSKDDGQSAESAMVVVESLDLEFTVTHDVVAPQNDKIEAKNGDRVQFKGNQFVVPAGEPIVIKPADENSKFAFQGITVQTTEETAAATEPN